MFRQSKLTDLVLVKLSICVFAQAPSRLSQSINQTCPTSSRADCRFYYKRMRLLCTFLANADIRYWTSPKYRRQKQSKPRKICTMLSIETTSDLLLFTVKEWCTGPESSHPNNQSRNIPICTSHQVNNVHCMACALLTLPL